MAHYQRKEYSMTQVVEDYSGLVGQRVILQLSQGDEVVDVSGKLEASNSLGILIRPKGRSNSQLVLNEDIVSLESDEEANQSSKGNYKLRPRRVKPVTEATVRRHLLDGHGVQLSWVNAVTADQALTAHQTMHEGDGSDEIGHYHAAKD